MCGAKAPFFWNAVFTHHLPPYGEGDGCGKWHDLPTLVFLVFRLWPTRKRAPTGGVDTEGYRYCCPLRHLYGLFSILPVHSSSLPSSPPASQVWWLGPEGCPFTATPSSSLGHLLFFYRSSLTCKASSSCMIRTGMPPSVVGTRKKCCPYWL